MSTQQAFVDLCTPPGSPAGAASGARPDAVDDGGGGSQVSVNLCTSPASLRAPLSNVANTTPTNKDGPSAKALGKRKAEAAPADAGKAAKEELRAPLAPSVQAAAIEEDEVLETAAPPAPLQDDVNMGNDDDDDDVQCTGRTGDNALSDFPHARENCVAIKFVQGQEAKHCANCYCYVCDGPAKECPQWAEHCKASHTSVQWQQKRAQWKARQSAPPAAAPQPAAALDSDYDSDDSDNWGMARWSGGEDRWSCEQLLKAIEQVYPVEHAEPKGFAPGMTLRPYQRQSLAFMLNIENSMAMEGMQTFAKGSSRYNVVHGQRVKGGWLSDEMGMGKTAVCTALALATRSNGKTIVICNNTLVGQVRSLHLPHLHPPPVTTICTCPTVDRRAQEVRAGPQGVQVLRRQARRGLARGRRRGDYARHYPAQGGDQGRFQGPLLPAHPR